MKRILPVVVVAVVAILIVALTRSRDASSPAADAAPSRQPPGSRMHGAGNSLRGSSSPTAGATMPGSAPAARATARDGGAITGRVVWDDDGSPVASYTVAVGWDVVVDVESSDGVFHVDGLAVGRHNLRIRGEHFVEEPKDAVGVIAGETAELGEIRVAFGRVLVGRVVDRSGAPVEGAAITYGRELRLGQAAHGLERKYATSDRRGEFFVGGIALTSAHVTAETEAGGAMARIAAGDDEARVVLTLEALGSLRGRVRMDGRPVEGARVIAAHLDSRSSLVSTTDADGAFELAQVLAGTYRVVVQVGTAGASASTTVTVPGGQTAERTIEITTGSLELQVVVRPKSASDRIDAAQVFLFGGEVTIATNAEIQETLFGSPGEGEARFAYTAPASGVPASFARLRPDVYSVCVFPMTGDLKDQAFVQRMNEHIAELAVHCETLDLTSARGLVQHEAAVPSMTALPAPRN